MGSSVIVPARIGVENELGLASHATDLSFHHDWSRDRFAIQAEPIRILL